MSETQTYVLGADILPGMVVDMPNPHSQFSNEQRLVLATERITRKRLFRHWIDGNDSVELLVVSNGAPNPFVVRVDPSTKYELKNVVQFMLNYIGPTIPDKVWVSKQS